MDDVEWSFEGESFARRTLHPILRDGVKVLLEAPKAKPDPFDVLSF